MKIITTHFNPQGYRRPIENYRRFRKSLGDLQEHLITVELSYSCLQEIPGALWLRGGPQNVMWQKERLINYVVSRLPPKIDRVCWVDADLLFLNPHWYEETVKLLDEHPVVQCFSGIHYLDAGGSVTHSAPSWAWNHCHPDKNGKYGPPGGALAARREALGDGLDESHLVGGGDQLMIQMWTGQWKCYLTQQANLAMRHYSMRRGWRAYERVRGNLGVTHGEVVHLFHGTREKRNYGGRTKILVDNDYDPETDIRVDENGLLEWASEKPGLHRAVAEYFAARDEDEEL